MTTSSFEYSSASQSFLYEETLLLTQSIADISMNGGSCDNIIIDERITQTVFDSEILIIEDNDCGKDEAHDFSSSNSNKNNKQVPSSKEQETVVVKPKKRTWRKPKDMPKRPMSAYNIYFQLARERLIQGQDDEQKFFTSNDVDRIVRERKIQDAKPKPKRKHRKSHGKIGFKEMASTIANSWKILDDVQRQVFTDRAAIEKDLYDKAVKEWSNSKEKEQQQEQSNTTKFQQTVDHSDSTDIDQEEKEEEESCNIVAAPISPRSVIVQSSTMLTAPFKYNVDDDSAALNQTNWNNDEYHDYNEHPTCSNNYQYVSTTPNFERFSTKNINVLKNHTHNTSTTSTKYKKYVFESNNEEPITLNGVPVPPVPSIAQHHTTEMMMIPSAEIQYSNNNIEYGNQEAQDYYDMTASYQYNQPTMNNENYYHDSDDVLFGSEHFSYNNDF